MMPTISSACAAVGGAAGNEAELSKTYPSAAISRKLFRYRPSISPLARKCRSSYHVEVAETGGDRDSSDIVDRAQRPVGGSRPRRASQDGNAEPDHSSASRGCDLVRLRSGGPEMTIKSVQGNWVICTWWSQGWGGFQSTGFPIAMVAGPVTLPPDDAHSQTTGQKSPTEPSVRRSSDSSSTGQTN